jgi:aspartyl-tRNA(Asn)/glutamyl-tRNA(Gln) amidotransferase subunit A
MTRLRASTPVTSGRRASNAVTVRANWLCNPEHYPQHRWDWFPWASFSHPLNFTQQPAAMVPAGLTPSGLPVGLQIVGRRFANLAVLQASAAFEAARPWHDLRPNVD